LSFFFFVLSIFLLPPFLLLFSSLTSFSFSFFSLLATSVTKAKPKCFAFLFVHYGLPVMFPSVNHFLVLFCFLFIVVLKLFKSQKVFQNFLSLKK
jgi:hypothetical protein